MAARRYVPPVDRASAEDLMTLAAQTTALPLQVGAALLLDTGAGLDLDTLRASLADRVVAVPRLRQQLVEVPFGCGRPVWVDDPGFRIEDHVEGVHLAGALDEASVLAVAGALLPTPLPTDRPLWKAVLVTGRTPGRAGLVVVVSHVLGDGLAGLAVLTALVDGGAGRSGPPFPQPRPTRRGLAADALLDRLRALRRLPGALRRLVGAATALRPALVRPAASCSLLRPTGTRRAFATATVDLGAVRAVGRAHGATVNDVLLAAVSGALHRLLLTRGEDLAELVVSVPVAARASAGAADLGNRGGVVRLALPAAGSLEDRLRGTVERTRTAKRQPRGASAALLAPTFRLLAAVGGYGWFISHQRLVHTFVSNLRGPAAGLTLRGCRVQRIVPLSPATGNVTVSFTALSYAGELLVTLNADPDAVPDAGRLRVLLQAELDGVRGLDAQT